MRRVAVLLVVLVLGASAHAGGRAKAVQETAEYLLKKFGRTAFREGAEKLATKLETFAARYGDDFLKAAHKVGPRTFHLVEKAGVHGKSAVGILAKYGEHGATWVVARPKGMQFALKYGDDAVAALVKHKSIAEPLLEHGGQAAVRALQAANAQSGRRLAMLLESGELARMGRNPELLSVIGKYGDSAMNFVWNHKGSLAVGAVLTAFLAHPEPFINGARDITEIVGETAVRPLASAPAAVATEVVRGTNWTAVFLALGSGGLLIIGLWLVRKTRAPRASV